jgi:arabinan endo-1,5-alpha-L-arabinosidase
MATKLTIPYSAFTGTGHGRIVGPGHPAILQDGDRDYIVYPAYDRQADGAPTLRIQQPGWTEDGWPVAI